MTATFAVYQVEWTELERRLRAESLAELLGSDCVNRVELPWDEGEGGVHAEFVDVFETIAPALPQEQRELFMGIFGTLFWAWCEAYERVDDLAISSDEVAVAVGPRRVAELSESVRELEVDTLAEAYHSCEVRSDVFEPFEAFRVFVVDWCDAFEDAANRGRGLLVAALS